MTARLLRRGEPGWPVALEHLDLPPAALWLRGPYRLDRPAVAVVGPRNPTMAAVEVARRLAGDLAAAGIAVISGLALGVDGSAHEGALDAGGLTVAVLGCGIDIGYPQRHTHLRRRIAASGLLLTEEPPGTFPAPWRFPRRNRIIAALATAVVVVEASDRSGALSTARHAADLGRDVLAVPGSPLSDRSSGTNRLIRDGATPVVETADLQAVDALRDALARTAGRARLALPHAVFASNRRTAAKAPAAALAPEQRAVLARIGADPIHPDRLAAALRLDPAELSRHLADLELAGQVRTLPGGLVARDTAPGPAAHTPQPPAEPGG
jgi:DNA processing protein